MQCNCGGTTTEHKVIEKGKVSMTYQQCVACGRVGVKRFVGELVSKSQKKISPENIMPRQSVLF